MPQYKIGQQLANNQGQVIEFNGTAWVPVQKQVSATRPEQLGINPVQQAQMNTLGTIEGGPEARTQQTEAIRAANEEAFAKQHPIKQILSGNPYMNVEKMEVPGYVLMGSPAAGTMKGIARLTIPRTSSAGAALEQIEKVAGKQIVDISGPEAVASRILELKEAGGFPPPVISAFIKRLNNSKKGPLTLKEARDFYKNATRLSIEETQRMKGEMGLRVKEFAATLDDSLTRASEKAAGMGAAYQAALREFYRASQIQRGVAATKQILGKEVVQGAARGAGLVGGAGGVYALLKQLGVIK